MEGIGEKISGLCKEGGQRITNACIGTCCGIILIPLCLIFLVIGEHNYVEELVDVENIRNDLHKYPDLNSAAEAKYNGKPIYYQGTVEVFGPLEDNAFGFHMNGAVYGSRFGYVLQWSKSIAETNPNGNPLYTFSKNWFVSRELQFTCTPENVQGGSCSMCSDPTCTLNSAGFPSPCHETSCSSVFYADAKAGAFDLSREGGSGIWVTSEYQAAKQLEGQELKQTVTNDSFPNGITAADWQIVAACEGLVYAQSQNIPTSCSPSSFSEGDANVRWEAAGPGIGSSDSEVVSILAKQGSTSQLERYKSGKDYEVIRIGYKTSGELIDIIQGEVDGRVFFARVFTFLGLWLGFRLLASFGDLLTDWIPCGGAEVFDILACCMAFWPAVGIWLVFFSISWLVFRPIPWGLSFLALGILVGGLSYYASREYAKKERYEFEGGEGANKETEVEMR